MDTGLNNLNSIRVIPSSGDLQQMTQYDIVDSIQMDLSVIFLILNVFAKASMPFYNMGAENVIDSEEEKSKHSFNWGYHGGVGPWSWPIHVSQCGGYYQSPINIDTSSVIATGSGRITMYNFDHQANVEIKNNGHSVYVNIRHDTMTVQNGGLDGPYQAVQFHFHWGSNDTRGSEHTINGRAFPMEVHVVCFKKMYGRLSAAITQPRGVAVLGALFEISDEDNENYNDLIKEIEHIKHPNDKRNFTLHSLSALLPSFNNYFRYHGSLTTPPCSESVVWNLSTNRIRISQHQMEKFRKVISSERDWAGKEMKLVDNYRPVQKLYGRRIFSNTMIY